ncbi:MAG: response regulator [Methylococcales bacterium]|nr:response regulator [Methylococcales bacterium]
MLNKLTIKNLFWMVALMAILATLIGVLGLTGMAKSSDGLKTVYLDRTLCISQLNNIKIKILSNRLAIANSLAFKDETLINIKAIKQNISEIDKLWQEYRATQYTQEEFRLSEKFEKDKLQLLQEGLTPGIDYLLAGNAEAVEKSIKTSIRPLFVIVEDDIDHLIQIQIDITQQEYLDSQAGYETNRLVITLILLTKILLVLVILAYIKVTIAKISKIIAATERIAVNEFDTQVGVEGNDEISEIAKSIANMQNVLREARDETNRLNWLKTGVIRVNKVVLGQMDITTLASKVINEIADYLDAKVGAIYIANEVEAVLELSLIGSFAYTHRKNLSSQFKLGEGLVGQSALERKQILLDNVPEDYIRISSGLGDTVPRNICVTPMLFEQTLEGVLEIGTLVPLKPIELEYLRLVIEAVAMAFEIAKTQSSMQSQQVALLTSNEELEAQVKIVALSQQELKAQQSELENINTELEAQMQRVKDSEDELKAQQEELEIANVELKSKNSLLEQQKGTNELARQELATQAEELTLASKYKSEFLANMSHELRTPLNSLLLLARSLTENRTGNLSEDQVETAGVIYDSGSDLLSLINEILDLSKIESGKMELRLQPVDIKDLMRTINIQFEHMAKNQGLTLNITCDEQLPRSITTDAQRLGQVIKNLVGNALKFTEQGSVSVAFTQIPAGTDLSRSHLDPSLALAIRVTDTGIGIPLDKQKIVFEAFQQADSGDRRRFGGTGLGLSISRELVSLLGGEIQLESEPGKGSTFIIYIPIKVLSKEPIVLDEMIQAESKHTLPAPIKIAQKATMPLLAINVDDDREELSDKDRVLLIIEDDLRFAKILAGNIRERGFKCLIALSGEEGLELAALHRPDGIVLDIHLPNMDGWAVLTELKQNVDTRHIPVHIVSSEDPTNDGLRIGAIGHLRKPVLREDIEAVLNRLEQATSQAEKRVLVVEDDPIMRRETVRAVGNGNVFVEEVDSGEKALLALRERHFSLVVLDLGLPDMQGMELLNAIAKEKIDMPPVIIYTVRDLSMDEEVALRTYANSIILKDVRSQERLIDEVALFLHRVVNDLPEDKKRVIRHLHESDDHLKGRKVLIVEDDMRTMFAMTKILASHGLNPIKADNGEKALEILNKHPDVDLILMDMMMPVMDGYEATSRIRKLPEFSHLPIIALTAKAMKEDRKKCLDAGASDYLSKPVDQDKLISLIRVWLCR